MDETHTFISYPIKLPINGPRCKKDPQVRVCGTEDEDVRLARDRILEVLDPKVFSFVIKEN